MTERLPVPGMPGGVPYDQDADWGFMDWTDSSEQSASVDPGDSLSAPNRARRSRVGLAIGLYLSAIIAVNLISSLDDDTHHDHVLKVSAVPGVLSSAVQSDYNAVLEVNYPNALGFTQLWGTAVKVGNNLALTAGHVVMSDGDSITSPECDTRVMSVFDDQGGNTPVQDWVGKNGNVKDYDTDGNPDYALLKISTDSHFTVLPSVPIATKPLHVGEKAFFINYEQISPMDNFNRYPSQADVPLRAYNSGSFSTTAAEFAGVVVGMHGHQYEIATGMRSYGPTSYSQSNLQPGGSGGAVLNTSGQLEGLSVARSDYLLNSSDVLVQYGVQLPLKSSQEFRVADVQPITPSLIKSSEAQLDTSASC